MKVYVKGQGEVRLTKNDFLAQGGEGSVYIKGGTAFKIYSNPKKMIPDGKFVELSSIHDPNVIKPEDIILSSKNKQIGYTMRYIADTYALCQLFTRVFKERNSIDPQTMLDLMQNMQKSIDNVHQVGVLIVDLNEMNFLINDKFSEVYFIDVVSYQTKHYPATAIMPSVRDYHTPIGSFTQESDWFSFAIVAFQMLIGIHPYKGKHPKVKGLEERMRGNISIFNSDVRIPKICYPLDVIPTGYRDWFKAVLEDGKRLAPPSDLHAIAVIAKSIRIIQSTKSLHISEVDLANIDVISLFDNSGNDVIRSPSGLYFNNRRVHDPVNGEIAVGFTDRMNKPVIAYFDDGLRLFNAADKKDIPVNIRVDSVMSYDGRLYIKSRDKVIEIALHEVGDRVVASTNQIVANVLEHASKLYEGVIIQNLIGSIFVSILDRSQANYQLRIPELDNHKIIDAKYDNGVLMVVGIKKGKYDRFIFRFDGKFLKYDMRVIEDISLTGLNFITLDSGICVSLTEEEKLEIFSRKIGSNKVKVIEDDILGNDMSLVKYKSRVAFIRDNKLYNMTMR